MENNENLKLYLSENYSKKSKNDIILDLKLSWRYIQKMANIFKIKRNFNESNNSFSHKILLSYDNISCYWIGFILADGHITKNKYIQINLSIKDREHLLKIENHIGKITKYEDINKVYIRIFDKPTVISISNAFKWRSNKTKYPPQIPHFLNEDQLFSLIIGFIDGDGSISKKGNIRIKCDSSWKNILEYFYKFLTKEDKQFKITSDNCSMIYISKYKIIKEIKNKAIQLNLPIMERKWDRIPTKHLKSDKFDLVKNLFLTGKSFNEIKLETKFSDSLLYKVKREIDIFL